MLSSEYARYAIEYRFMYRNRKIFDYTEITDTVRSGYTYPVRLEARFLESIKANDELKMKICIEEIEEYLSAYSYHETVNTLNQLAITMEKEFTKIVDFKGFDDGTGFEHIYKSLRRFDYLDDGTELFKRLGAYIIREDRSRDTNALVGKACDYINLHHYTLDGATGQVTNKGKHIVELSLAFVF